MLKRTRRRLRHRAGESGNVWRGWQGFYSWPGSRCKTTTWPRQRPRELSGLLCYRRQNCLTKLTISHCLRDGTRRAFVAVNHEGRSTPWLRSLSFASAQDFSATEGAMYPFWSPDSRRIGSLLPGSCEYSTPIMAR